MTRTIACLLALRAAATVAAAPEPPSPPAGAAPFSYSRRVWQSAEGLPEDLAQAVAQTQDGYLWIGTSGGLVRFDGVRFAFFNHENEAAFLDDSVYSLRTTRDGTLWAGTEGGGLLRYQGGSFRRYGAEQGLSDGFVRVIFEDRSGRLWVGTDGGLFRMQGEALVRIDGRNGLPSMNIHSICEDRLGRLLVGGTGLIVLDAERPVYYASRESMADNNVRAIREAADGSVWIATISGLRRLPGGVRGDPFAAPKLIHGVNTCVLLETRSRQVWIGTYGRGLMRYDGRRMESLSAPATLPHNNVLALFEDSEENVWVGTQGGLLRLSPSAASTVTTADGAPLSINSIYQDPRGGLCVTGLNGRLFRIADQVLVPLPLPAALGGLRMRNAFRDSRGGFWVGTDGQGAARLEGSRVSRYTVRDGLVNDFVRAFCEDREGSIWIGTDGGLSRLRDGRFESFTGGGGLVHGSIRALLLDRRGRLWVATEGGLSRFESGRFVADPPLERLRGLKVWALHEDPQDGLWAGTQGAGLFWMRGSRVVQFTKRQGLPSDKILSILEDRNANLWMGGPSGIVSVSRRDLEALADSPASPVAMRVYTTAEGLRTNQVTGGVQPAGAVTPAGELWFPSTKGAVRIAPGVPERESSPRVLIEQVLADDRQAVLSRDVRLPPGEGKLEVHYTAIRLRSPERIRFKYWLEGFENDWTTAGQRRVAYYTNLPAGSYRFHVVAYELNAPSAAAEQVLGLEWRPHFYETAWFVALCVLLALGAAGGAYGLHVRNLRRRFAAVLDERGRLAREMHDTLVQGCVGVSTLLEAAARAQDVSPQIGNELLDRARSEVRATVDEARMAIWNLRHSSEPAEQLVPALSHLAQRISLESGIAVRFEASGEPSPLGAGAEHSLLMLVREALQNSIRHALPRSLSVLLRFDRRRLSVEIEDDGCGFDPSTTPLVDSHHYGLIGMRERVQKLGGDFEIASAPGQGTHLRLSIPIAAARADGRTI